MKSESYCLGSHARPDANAAPVAIAALNASPPAPAVATVCLNIELPLRSPCRLPLAGNFAAVGGMRKGCRASDMACTKIARCTDIGARICVGMKA